MALSGADAPLLGALVGGLAAALGGRLALGLGALLALGRGLALADERGLLLDGGLLERLELGLEPRRCEGGDDRLLELVEDGDAGGRLDGGQEERVVDL